MLFVRTRSDLVSVDLNLLDMELFSSIDCLCFCLDFGETVFDKRALWKVRGI